ncbi:MAG TPA: VOC family protein [Gemmatimonadaceae bacterium]|jgi:catechol 2,3-dioxygenase-like lactoylglutathione lyase family enzyme
MPPFRSSKSIAIACIVGASSALAVFPTHPLSAQGRCIRAYGTPACNTDSIPAIFARTGWRTSGLDHIAFRVADPQKEAAFYTALMGWKVRSDDGTRVVMDIGNWGTAVFRKVSADSFPPPRANARANAVPVHAVVEGFGFDIEPWNAKTVEAELKKRGLNPVAENGPNGFESFHVKDPDGFDLQISNGKGFTKSRASVANAKLSTPAPFEPTGWQTVWLDHLSYGAVDYKKSVSFYVNLLGWQPTYDEGSQNELMIGDVGDMIIRGGNPLDPNFGKGNVRAGGRIDHISFGISPWDTDNVKEELEKRGLPWTIDTSDGADIHVAQFKSYHTTTPNGYNLQMSYNTRDTRLNLAIAVNPRRGVK